MRVLNTVLAKLPLLRARLLALGRDDRGVTAVEYGLIAALVAVAIIGGATTLGQSLNAMFDNVGARITAAAP